MMRQGTHHCVETLELRTGMSLVLSQFDPGKTRSFMFTEKDDLFGFGFHLRGGAHFEVEDCEFDTRVADVWACAAPRGSTSNFYLPPTGFRTVSIRFEPDVANDLFDEGLGLPTVARDLLKQVRNGSGIAQLASLSGPAVARLESMFSAPYSGVARRFFLESCALGILADQVCGSDRSMRPQGSVRSRHRDKALAARDYLDSHFQDPPTIVELSRIVGTNEFTLKRAFKDVIGTTIFAYVSHRRMERAKLLLQQGMSVSSAAQNVGYECVRSFSAAFRRQTGYSPSAVRRAAL